MAGVEESRDARIRLPQLKLDELLEELQARLDAARGTRDRVHSLLEAVLSVGRELELEQALHSIVEAAAVLVDAEYAALGVITPDGKALSAFHTIGVTEEQIAAIGPYPEGHGILGELIRHPEPLRLAKISQHSASYGFPSNHPPMNTFLGVPIRVREHVFGNLYLTEKRGGAQFDDEDESVLSTLAVAAGVAIDNARLYEESRLRERWLRANAEITHNLMSGDSRTQVLGLIAERAGEITGSALTAVALPMEDTGSLAVEIAVGMDAEAHQGLVLSLDRSLMGLAFSRAAPVTSADVSHDERISLEPRASGDSAPPWRCPSARARQVCAAWCCSREKSGGCPSRRRRPRPCRPSPRRPPSRWNWRNAVGTPSRSRFSRTATASPATCTTSPSNDSSPPA